VKRKRFEDILDECISAYLSGQRSVEESLSLYPSLARELEPLLRAAADTAAAIQELKPPAYAQERIRLNILRAASERAAARSLTSQIEGFGPNRREGLPAWMIAAPAAAVVAAVLGLSAVLISGGLSGGDETPTGDTSVAVSRDPGLVQDLTDVRRRLDVIRQKARAGVTIRQTEIQALTGATLRLGEAAESQPLEEAEQDELEDIISDQLVLLSELSAEADSDDEEEIEDALDATFGVAIALGIPIEEPTNVVTASPSPTESPVASPTPEATPGPSPAISPPPSPQSTATTSSSGG